MMVLSLILFITSESLKFIAEIVKSTLVTNAKKRLALFVFNLNLSNFCIHSGQICIKEKLATSLKNCKQLVLLMLL